jgi:NAD(P)-dependent dehydrogenase (short-subunit alcohol dehydrogenase family)
LTGFADWLRLEEAARGVRVTSGYPGGVATDLLRNVRAGFGGEFYPARLVSRGSFAQVIASLFDAPADVDVTDISSKPAPSLERDHTTEGVVFWLRTSEWGVSRHRHRAGLDDQGVEAPSGHHRRPGRVLAVGGRPCLWRLAKLAWVAPR